MKTTTQKLLATLATECQRIDDPQGAGSRPVTLARPAGRPLRNDGIRHHWLQEGFAYRIELEGPGWRVTCPDWTGDWAGHEYRIVESDDMQFVASLPTVDGAVALVPGQAYELRETHPGGAWGIYTA
jgi:hypothetical protein